MSKFMKIKIGIGQPGKLWTGDDISKVHDMVAQPVAYLIRCACGRTTRKLRFQNVIDPPDGIDHKKLDTLWVFTGGVGSYVSSGENWPGDRFWNWSGREGGVTERNPYAVVSGYVCDRDLPPCKEGFEWVRVYWGNTMAEYVLLKIEENAEPVTPRLKNIEIPGTCPPCREAMEKIKEEGIQGYLNSFHKWEADNDPYLVRCQLPDTNWYVGVGRNGSVVAECDDDKYVVCHCTDELVYLYNGEYIVKAICSPARDSIKEILSRWKEKFGFKPRWVDAERLCLWD